MKFTTVFLLATIILCFSIPGFSQNIISEMAISNENPEPNTEVTVSILIDTRATTELLGGFTGYLKWDATVLNFVSHSGIQAGFTGLVNSDSTKNGRLDINGIQAQGASGELNILTITFHVANQQGDSTKLNLEYSAMSAALTFTNLLPVLIVNDGVITVASKPSSVKKSKNLPNKFQLYQNYPNPFNPETRIQYQIVERGEVKLTVFNVLGQRVRNLVNLVQNAGYYDIQWDGKDDSGQLVQSGVYLYELRTNAFVEQRKAMFLK